MDWASKIATLALFAAAGCATLATPVRVTYFSVPLMKGYGAQVAVGRLSAQKFFLFKDDAGRTSAVEACTPSLELPGLPSLPVIP
jgi:hypothetical protein